MTSQTLSKEQESFLEECQLEFSDRYTDADVEYKRTYDAEIPPPPIMYPWYGRPKSVPNRDRSGGSYRSGYREHRHENNYRDRDGDRHQYRENDRDRRYQDNRRYRPY